LPSSRIESQPNLYPIPSIPIASTDLAPDERLPWQRCIIEP
jgi:hypothetical protein